MTFLSKIRSAYRIVSDTEAETRYQYYVDFNGFPSQGKKGKYLQWLFAKKDLKKILDGWDKIAVWIQAGKSAKDTAIVKKKASVPLRDYLERSPNKENTNVLYHGVGKDFAGQADLMMKYMDVDLYDPYFKDQDQYSKDHLQTIKDLKVPFDSQRTRTPPEERKGGAKEYGHIHSHYTLNVVTKDEGKKIVQHIYDLLSDSGKAVISVRRDVDLVGKIDPSLKAKIKADHEFSFKTLKEEQVGRANDMNVSLIAWSDTHLKSNPDKKKYSISCNHDHRGLLAKKSTQFLSEAEKLFDAMLTKYKMV